MKDNVKPRRAFPPDIDAGECEIMRGRFGSKGWIYTGIVAVGFAATLVLIPLALWFWLRSSRFVLTDRRLMVKPTIGKLRVIPTEQLYGAKVTYGSATDTVAVDGPVKLRLRYQRASEEVWGAFLAMSVWQMPAPSPLRGTGCELCAQTKHESDEVSQGGVTVISGTQLAFIPLNSGLRKGGLGKKAALAAVGVREVTNRAWFPHHALVNSLVLRGGDFSGNVAALAETLGGLVWSLPNTKRRLSKRGIVVSVFDEELQIYTDQDSAKAIAGRV